MAKENTPKGGFFERIAEGYFYGEKGSKYVSHRFDNELGDQELDNIRSIRLRALLYSALCGAMGVILLYVPPHYFPEAFKLWTVSPVIAGSEMEIPLFATLYGLILAIAEIYLLVFINIRAVHKMAIVCGFPPKEDPDYHLHVKSLVNIGVEKNAKNELSIGLNPLQGYSKSRLIMIFIWNRVKASLSNVIFKMIVRRIMGRYAVRILVDLAGIPVMAGWNAYAANNVLRQAKVRILAPNVIQYTLMYLHRKHANETAFRDIAYDVLQFLAVKKRSFHENHYLLSINLLKTFGIEHRSQHLVGEDFYDKVLSLPTELRNDLAKLMVIGIIIDGSLSAQEKKSIREMQEHGIFLWNTTEVKEIMDVFVAGKGIGMLREKLGMELEKS